MVDITDETETQRLKAKWTTRGVPESLFDAFIAEANAEYDTSIGYDNFSRFAILTLNIVDANFDGEHFYRAILCWGGYVIMGKGTATLTAQFGQVPTIQLHIEIFKVSNDGTIVNGYGALLFTHTKDEAVTITINAIGEGEAPPTPFTYLIFDVNDGYVMVGEDIAVADCGIGEDTLTRAESVTITNS